MWLGPLRSDAPTDSPDSTMALMMDHAFEAARQPKDLRLTDRSRTQWAALFKTFIPKGGRHPRTARQPSARPAETYAKQFIDALHLISKRMGPDGRALFVIDPEKLVCQGCTDSGAW